MMNPMPGPGDRQRASVLKIVDAAVVRRWSGPGVEAVNQQGGTGDAGPKAGDGVARHVVGRPQADILIEFPAISSVFVLVHAVLGQMAGLFWGQMSVGFAHAGMGCL